MENSFNEVVEAFDKLKERFQAAEISRQEFIDEMKRLRIKDDQGRFWMIGAQTGKWYYFDGKDWVQDDPPSQKEKKAICVHCGFENKLEAESCGRCGGTMKDSEPTCDKCGAALPKPYVACPACGAAAIGGDVPAVPTAPAAGEADGEARPEPAEKKPAVEESAPRFLRSVKPLSFLLFGGALGTLGGLLFGAFAGATGYFDAQLGFLPDGLLNFQGSLPRAGIFAVLGAVAGFIILALIGFLKALIVNLILSVIGGIEYQAEPRRRYRSEAAGKDEAEARPPFGLMG
jgi:hypothetical protein